MLVDAKNLKWLVEIFVDLNENRQNALMSEAIRLQFEQGQESLAKKKNESITTEELKSRTRKTIKEATSMIGELEKLNDDQRAAFMILLNGLAGGSLATEESITITIDSKDMSLSDFVYKYVPGADADRAKAMAQNMMKSQKENLLEQ